MRAASLVLVAALVAGASAYKWGRQTWNSVATAYWQSRCLNYMGDPQRVVCEERADRPAMIDPGLLLDRSDLKGTRLVAPTLPCFAHLAAICNWGHLGGAPTTSTECAILFCHRRTTSGGHDRLVIVTRRVMRFQEWDDIDIGECFGVHIITPASFGHNPSVRIEVGGPTGDKPVPILSYTRRARFFEGSADATDHSHFTIGYHMDGVAGVIDGWLHDDPIYGERVLMRVQSGPAHDGSR
jgi:hypothetical protein